MVLEDNLRYCESNFICSYIYYFSLISKQKQILDYCAIYQTVHLCLVRYLWFAGIKMHWMKSTSSYYKANYLYI